MSSTFPDGGLLRVWRMAFDGAWNCLFQREQRGSILPDWEGAAEVIASILLHLSPHQAELATEVGDWSLLGMRDKRGVLIGLTPKGSNPLLVWNAMRRLEKHITGEASASALLPQASSAPLATAPQRDIIGRESLHVSPTLQPQTQDPLPVPTTQEEPGSQEHPLLHGVALSGPLDYVPESRTYAHFAEEESIELAPLPQQAEDKERSFSSLVLPKPTVDTDLLLSPLEQVEEASVPAAQVIPAPIPEALLPGEVGEEAGEVSEKEEEGGACSWEEASTYLASALSVATAFIGKTVASNYMRKVLQEHACWEVHLMISFRAEVKTPTPELTVSPADAEVLTHALQSWESRCASIIREFRDSIRALGAPPWSALGEGGREI